MTPEAFLGDCLARVESRSIREWAMTEHNRPIFLKLASNALAKSVGSPCPHTFTAYILALAMGL